METEFGIVQSKTIPLSNDDFSKTVFGYLGKYSSNTALIEAWSSREITFAGLKRDSESVARHLVKIGVRKGDVVGIFAQNSIDWIVAFLGIIRIGGVVAAISSQLKRGELRHQLSIIETKVLFTSSNLVQFALEFSEALKFQIIATGDIAGCISLKSITKDSEDLSVIPSFDELNLLPNDPILIVFSSGTTGAPKAVVLSHRNLETQRQAICNDPSTNFLSPKQIVFAPLYHNFGLFFVIYGLINGSLTYLLQRFDFKLYLKLLQELEIKFIAIVPPIAVLLAKSPEVDNFCLHLKMILCAAAPLSEQIENQLKQRFQGVIIVQSYGLTEVSAVSNIFPVFDVTAKVGLPAKPQSVGPPCANVRMKVINENGDSLGPNTKGEICITGPNVMLGYLNNSEATSSLIDKHGWVHTGDLGYYDEDGYFYLVDRIKELIKYKAFQVAPAELETVLLSHPLIADAGVIGRPDVEAGELPMAWVVKKSNASLTEKEVEQFVSDRIASIKKLRGGVCFVESIPKSPTGKILRNAMRNDLMRGKL